MQLGVFSFILQAYYAREWADNFVVHVTVSDVGLWWDHIVSLDLPARYGVRTQAPESQGWAVVAGVTDPSVCSGDLPKRKEICPNARMTDGITNIAVIGPKQTCPEAGREGLLNGV
jgi:hypothetical protein